MHGAKEGSTFTGLGNLAALGQCRTAGRRGQDDDCNQNEDRFEGGKRHHAQQRSGAGRLFNVAWPFVVNPLNLLIL